MIKNKYIKYLVIAFFGMVFIFVFNKIDNKNISPKNENNKEVKEDVLSFEKEVNNFENYYKKALVFSGRGDQKHSYLNSKEALSLWEDIYKNFKSKQSTEYNKTTDWQKDLELVYEISIKSNKLIQNKKLKEANQELEKVRVILRKMRRENEINSLNDQLFDFYEVIIPVVEAKEKKETLQYMKNLKLSFLSLKELNVNEDYNKKINNIEKSISGVDSLIGSDFKRSQKELLKYFEDLYISVK